MSISTFGTVILASPLACVVTIVEIIVIRRYENWGNSNVAYFMSIAAGVLISVSFIHIIPKSFDMNEISLIFLLVAFLSLYLINRFLKTCICHGYNRSNYTLELIPMLGVGFHSFLDGVIYSVMFNVSIFTGILAAMGSILHEFPEGIVTFLLIGRAGFDRKKSTLYAIIVAAISTSLGTLVFYPLIKNCDQSTLGALLTLSAGALVYVGAPHFRPAVEKENKRYCLGLLSNRGIGCYNDRYV